MTYILCILIMSSTIQIILFFTSHLTQHIFLRLFFHLLPRNSKVVREIPDMGRTTDFPGGLSLKMDLCSYFS